MINEDIKPKDFAFIPEREERKFEEEGRIRETVKGEGERKIGLKGA